ncbi:hypothetical protein PSACC_03190 [Paramicrosporidium saccamoebae]|uniref:Uncharacterized protein n=1 Tax=Paramicrosporidium saccamoebae TaxID=1246581 RepID=A0A2H9TH89_9FUNG|nr:hypothetical protein PSACC_03190 [Paramicrosporidium saccamoebae]
MLGHTLLCSLTLFLITTHCSKESRQNPRLPESNPGHPKLHAAPHAVFGVFDTVTGKSQTRAVSAFVNGDYDGYSVTLNTWYRKALYNSSLAPISSRASGTSTSSSLKPQVEEVVGETTFSINCTTWLPFVRTPNGLQINAGAYRIVVQTKGSQIFVVTIPKSVRIDSYIQDISCHGLTKMARTDSSVTGMLIQDCASDVQGQYESGPLLFALDGRVLAAAFDWSTLDFSQLRVYDSEGNIDVMIQRQQPSVQVDTASARPSVRQSPEKPAYTPVWGKFASAIYSYKGTTTLTAVSVPNGVRFTAGDYMIAFQTWGNQMAVLATTDFVRMPEFVNGTETQTITELRHKYPNSNISGVVIRDYMGTNIQYAPGPLVVSVDDEQLTTRFEWKLFNFDRLCVYFHNRTIDMTIRKEHGHFNPLQRTLTREQAIPATLTFIDTFRDANYSYKCVTQYKVTEHFHGVLFSGDQYRILLASVGRDIVVIAMEDESLDATIVLNRILTDGLQTTASNVAGLSGILIRERSPRVVELVKGPLSVLVGNRALKNDTLSERQTLQAYQVTDPNDKFRLVLTRLNQ